MTSGEMLRQEGWCQGLPPGRSAGRIEGAGMPERRRSANSCGRGFDWLVSESATGIDAETRRGLKGETE